MDNVLTSYLKAFIHSIVFIDVLKLNVWYPYYARLLKIFLLAQIHLCHAQGMQVSEVQSLKEADT